ncbi:hypothetical protein Lepto7375DRAFT_7498 [Leptolyngbya sp. PCC 7375]|nr:hypothetical protein Lepto7375DRAFT_7498 [Leptolyngbya sp. PCC 7375]
MDIALLATFLSPFLPHLVKLGSKAAEAVTEAISEKFGEAAWTKAQKIWQQLSPKVEAKEELEALLNENPQLAEAITKIMQEDAPDGTPGTQIVQTVTGDKNQTIGQVFGGTVVGNVEGDVRM